MIFTALVPESKETDGEFTTISISRKVNMRGEVDDIITDIKAIGYTLAKHIRDEGKPKEQAEADRYLFEQAFMEGFRMTTDEVKEMDDQGCNRMNAAIVDAIQGKEDPKCLN